MAAGSRSLLALALFGGALSAAPSASAADADPIAIAVIDLDYIDTSGEVRDQRQEHAARIARFSEALRSDLARSGKFRIVAPRCEPPPCSAAASPSELIA